MIKFSTILLFLFIGCYTQKVSAQQNLQEVIYLKNGSIIRGTIIEQVPNKTIKIQTIDGNVFAYQMDEVEKITKEPTYTNEKTDMNGGVGRYAGYFFFGVSPLINQYSGKAILSFHAINGIVVGKHTTIGIGIGYEFINEYNYDYADQIRFIPIWLDARTFFLEGNLKPYIYGNIGFTEGQVSLTYLNSTTTSNWQAEGFNYIFGAGIKYEFTQYFGMLLEAGFRGQDLKSSNLNAIAIHLGITY